MRVCLLVLAAACGSPVRPVARESAPAAPPGCTVVPAGSALRERARIPGARLCLAPGRHQGPVAIAAGTVVWGPPLAVIERREGGTVVEIGAGGALLGATVDGQGGVFDREDAAVRLAGDGARVEGVTIVNAVFGVLAERVARVTIRANHVDGDLGPAMGLRGDPIRLWETQDSVVTGNVVRGGRDVVVWYSSGNHLEDNRIEDARYGTHLMYSHDNEVARNHYTRDVVGVFVMYSHDVVLADNRVLDAGGVAGMAIGLKDSGNITVRGNAFVHDHTGLYIDQTPLEQSHTLAVAGNLFGRCDAAVVLHGGGHRTQVTGNDFVASGTAVAVEGGGDTGDVAWTGNYWSDYDGYDLDGDGTGDVGYELRSFEGDLVDREPGLAFFHDTAALAAADAITRLVPISTPRVLLADPAPRMQPHDWEVRP